jgi:molecular chaperone DnaK (HSP70)
MTLRHEGRKKTFIGADFGNLTTKLTIRRGNGGKDLVPVVIPGISRNVFQGGNSSTSVIPSLIHYTRDDQILIGMQVINGGLAGHEGTVRWMAHYTSLNSPVRFRQGLKLHSYRDAASDFLSGIIMQTSEIYQVSGAEIIIAVPAGSRENYSSWMQELIAEEIVSSVRIIERPEAVACSCPGDVRDPHTLLIIDFGGSGLEVSIVTGCRSDGEDGYRIVGRAWEDIGGKVLDRLLLDLALHLSGLHWPDKAQTETLLQECEKAKEELSRSQSVDLSWEGKRAVQITRQVFEDMIESKGLYGRFSTTIEQALHNASQRGYAEACIRSVILTGGSVVIPSFRRLVEARFRESRIYADRPLDAVSRGAASWKSRSRGRDQVTCEYAIRIWNPEIGAFELRTIIRKGCPVPSNGAVARFRIQGTYDGQTRLGVPIYEIPSPSPGPGGDTQKRELRFESPGMIRVEDEACSAGKEPGQRWMNEGKIPLIPADPPAMRGEPRFELCFSINGSRELMVSARDLRTGRQVLDNVRAGVLR